MTFFKQNLGIIYLLMFATVILFVNLSAWGVTETSEARYAEIGREMINSGDYVHPKLLGIGHYHKPPVTYWITALSYDIFGVNVFAARFFLQVAVLIQVLLIYIIGLRLFKNRKTALFAAAIYFSFPAVIIGSRALTTDTYLTTLVLAVIVSWMSYREKYNLWALFAFYVLLGIGFLDKGPVIFIVPIVFVVAYNRLVQAEYKSWKYHSLGIFLMLAISFSWFVVLYKEDHAFADYFIFKHTIDRFATNTFGRKQPFWFYLVIVPLTSFPWAFIVLRALKRLKQKAYSVDSVLLIWIFLPLIFFSLSTSKLILYVLPIYGGIALLAAHSWERVKNKLRWDAGFLIFTGIVVLALGLMPLFDHSLVYGFLWFCSIGLLMMVSITLYVRMKSKSPDRLLIYLSVVFTSSLTVLASIFFHNNPAKVHDQRNVAAFIKDIPDVEKIYVYNERLPSLAFNLDRSIISIADGHSDLDREIQFERNQKWESLLIKPWDLQPADVEQSVFVAKVNHGINEYFKDSFVAAYQNSHVVDGWVIYY